MKKVLKPVLGLFTLIFLSSCFGGQTIVIDGDEHDDIYYYKGDTISIYDKSALSGEVTIPSEHNGTKITKIGKYGFQDCDKVTSFIIPDNITSIGEGAFSGCKALTQIDLPFVGGNKEAVDSKETIFGYIFGKDAKEGCTQTRTYYYPNGGTVSSGYISYIPSNLTKVTIRDALSIPLGAFRDVSMVKEVVLNPSISEIGESAFQECGSLESISFIEGSFELESIKTEAFRECKNLERFNSSVKGEFILPKTLDDVGEYAFEGCVKMEKYTAPFIGNSRDAKNKEGFFGYIFGLRSHDGTTLVKFDYVDSALEMHHEAKLYVPSGLREVTINDSNRVPAHAFRNMSMLTSLRITSLAQDDVGEHAFDGCGAEPTWF